MLLKLALTALPFVISAYKKRCPSLKKAWPIDVREGFKNTEPGTRYYVFLDGVEQPRCCAASERSGHILAYNEDWELEVRKGKVTVEKVSL